MNAELDNGWAKVEKENYWVLVPDSKIGLVDKDLKPTKELDVLLYKDYITIY